MQQVELVAAQHILSTYSSPCFTVKIVYNYGLRHYTATKGTTKYMSIANPS
jgi:hypothetical protein